MKRKDEYCKVNVLPIFVQLCFGKETLVLKQDLEVYIHIPFCVKKCNYCDFLSFSNYNELYVPALIKEIENASIESEDVEEYIVKSIFIGGGTPSLLKGEYIRDILQCVYKRFEVDSNAEITIEANPGTIDQEKLEIYKAAGINRISFGLQSTNNNELTELGRIHTFEQFLENYQLARDTGFANINVDLMSAIPGQTVESWNEVLNNVVRLSPEHISAYSLIIEEGTMFYEKYSKDDTGLPSEEEERQMYYNTKKILEEAGYHRYEISNYSKPGYECRHNIGYWQGVNYIGFGLGAFSYMNHTRFSNANIMKEYLDAVENHCRNLHREVHSLSVQEEMEEFMFLGLRMIEGVSVKAFEEKFHSDFESIYGMCVNELTEKSLLQMNGDRVLLSSKGIDLSNQVMAEFLLS